MTKSAFFLSLAYLLVPVLLVLLSAQPASAQMPAHEYDILIKSNELAQSGQLDVAEASVRDFLETHGISDDGRVFAVNLLGFVQYQKDDVSAALATYKDLLRLRGVDRAMRQQTTYTVAQLAMVTEDYESALDYLTTYLAYTSPTAQDEMLRVQILYSLKRYEDMIEPAKRAISMTQELGMPVKEDWWTMLKFAGVETGNPGVVAYVYDNLVEAAPSEELVAEAARVQLAFLDTSNAPAAMARYVEMYPDGGAVTPLQAAVANANADSVAALIAEGADIEAMGQLHRTPLQLAAGFGDEAMVERLLAAGADVSARNSGDETALLFAAYGGHREIVETLWRAGGDISYKAGKTSPVQLMARDGHAQLVGEILDAHPELVQTEGGRALMLAATDGQSGVVRLLLARGVGIEHRAEGGTTLLQAAASSGDLASVAAMLEAGAAPDETYDDRLRPLSIAARRGHYEVAAALIEAGADVDASNSVNRAAIYFAADEDHGRIVELLLANDAAPDIADTFGSTPLYTAANSNAQSAVAPLVDAGANVNHVSGHGWSVLAVAAGESTPQVVELLLDSGADPNGGDGKNVPLRLAISNNQPEIISLLVAAGAETQGEPFSDNSAVLYAVVAEKPEAVEALIAADAEVMEPASFLAGWKKNKVTKFLKNNGFSRTGTGDVETWSTGSKGRAVSVRKQRGAYAIADIIRMAQQSRIEIRYWIEAGRES